MKNLFEKDSYAEVIIRLDSLTPGSQRQWGKMNVAQMLTHCSIVLEGATGKRFPKRLFIGRIFGRLAKSQFSGPRPFAQSTPTDPGYVVTNEHDFFTEKERLRKLIIEFHEGGETKCTTHPHSFFGPLSTAEWSVGM